MAISEETSRKVWSMLRQLENPNYRDEPLIRRYESTDYKKAITKSMPSETQLLYRMFNSNNKSRINSGKEPITLEEYCYRKDNNQYLGKDAIHSVISEHNFVVMNNNRKKRNMPELTWDEYIYRKQNNIMLN